VPVIPIASIPRRIAAGVSTAASAFRYSGGLLLRYAPAPGGLLLAQAVAVGAAAPLAVWAMQGLINAVTRAQRVTFSASVPWLALLLVAFLLQQAFRASGIYLSSLARERVDEGLRRQVYAQALALPLAAFERPDYYAKLDTGRQALGGSLIFLIQQIGTLVSTVVGLAGLLLLYASVHWLLAAILLVTAIVRAHVGAQLSRAFTQVQYRSSPLKRELGYWTGLLLGREAAPELRLFGLGAHLLGRWQAVFQCYLDDMQAARRQLALYELGSVTLQEVVSFITVIALLAFGVRGSISIGGVVALLYSISRFRELTQSLAFNAHYVVDQWVRMQHLRDFLALPTELTPDHPRRRPPRPIRQGVRFHDVGFTYPGSSSPVLRGVALVLRPGEHVALVGENGAGKTTLVRLLLGLYRPTRGRITVDGIDLADLDPSAWRNEATAVFQDFMRYQTSVVENIAYADATLLPADGIPASTTHPRIVEAAKRSGAASFIDVLPSGYSTLLGKALEGAADLSSGQWQRLALARAYLRDAQIVALDEPTAALDPRGEVEVYRQFARAAAGRCAVFISHRLGSARLADRVVVLRQGRSVEEGSHDALLRQGGEYARMYRLQANWYQDGDKEGGER